jgi:hypothetical protein
MYKTQEGDMEGRVGTLRECMTDAVKEIGIEKIVPLLAEFTGMQKETVIGWFDQEKVLEGFTAMKLVAFLGLMGYEVTDMAKLEPDATTVRLAIGFGVSSPEQVAKLLGTRVPSVSRILRGAANTSTARSLQMSRYAKRVQGQLNEAKAHWSAKLYGTEKCPPATVPALKSEPATAEAAATAIDSSKIVDSLVSIFNSIGNIASIGINPKTLAPDVKLHIAFTTSQLFKRLGIDAGTLEELQRRQEQSTGNVANLARILRVVQGGK